jgi:hypothetical protein
MAKKKLTIDDIFNDDDFGLLDSKVKTSTVKRACTNAVFTAGINNAYLF